MTNDEAQDVVADDIVERLLRCPDQFPPYSVRTDAADEIKRLRRWKAEATIVQAHWESVVAQVVQELDLNDYIGLRKPDIVAVEVARLRAEVARLRAAGDALASQHERWGADKRFPAGEVHAAWWEARRG